MYLVNDEFMNKDIYIYNPSTNIKFCFYIISCIMIINVTDYNMNGVSKFEISTSGDKYTRGKKEYHYFSLPLHI